MEILKVENLTKVYGKGENEVRALNGVSFSVEKGDFVAIIGAFGQRQINSSAHLGGVDRPTGGKVLVNGQDVYSRSDEQIAFSPPRSRAYLSVLQPDSGFER